MNKTKMIFWLIIIGFIALVIAQNQNYFLAKQGLGINLVFAEYKTPELYNAVYFLAVFVIGLLIAYFFSLFAKFKTNQVIKNLNLQLNSRAETIARLESENDSLKKTASETNQKSTEEDSEIQNEKPIPDESA